jgi:two-component system, OmpR family, aerobic respiration control sensor histidine kinase ArcB
VLAHEQETIRMQISSLSRFEKLLSNDFVLTLLLLLSYFIFAKIGFLFGALTSNASLLWPPSGLALFAITLFGKRALLGLMLGAIAVIQWLAPADALANTFTNFLITLIMAASSIGQAWLIAFFARGLYARQFRVGPKGSLYFVGYVLLACMIAPTVGCISLLYAGVVNSTAAIQSWAVWWVGDAIGVLVLFPLLLWLNRRRIFTSQHSASTFLLVCSGAGAILLIIAAVGHFDRTNKIKNFLGSEDIFSWLLPSSLQLFVLLIGIVIISLLSAYLSALHKHELLIIENQKKLEAEVLAQTEALRCANDWLLAEVAERKHAQDRLTIQESHLRTLLDNLPNPVWLKSIDGVYLHCNKAVEKLLNLKESEIIGKTSADFSDKELSNTLKQHEELALQTNEAIRNEVSLFVPIYNEHRLIDIVKVAVRDADGKPLSILAISHDITEQKRIERTLHLAKQTAEAATNAKTLFLANMSHEIRTPLNAILGYSQLLTTDQSLTTQQHERISAILGAGQRLLHLINDILDLTKIEAGALHLRSDYFDLHQEMHDVISLIKNKAVAKGLSFNYKVELPSPAIVKSDQQKIGQVLLNLLGNAIKFTNAGDVLFSVKEDSGNIHFHIEDTGSGISTTEMQKLFIAFQQGKAGETMGGTGLGLVISKHLAMNLGGNLELKSSLDKGTHAHLFLPLNIEQHRAQPLRSPRGSVKIAQDYSCSVLVVEDDADSRDVLTSLLRNSGCSVSEAENGDEGLRLALANKFDIIFTDIRMPIMTGIEMLSAIRAHITKDALPVVAVSASSLEHERSFYLAQGFDDFIGKPYEFNEVYSALANLTKAHLVFSDENPVAPTEHIQEKMNWQEQKNLPILAQQLKLLGDALHSGDLGKSKSLYAELHVKQIGNLAYQQLQNAIRHYDLALAEKILTVLLAEMAAIDPSISAT